MAAPANATLAQTGFRLVTDAEGEQRSVSLLDADPSCRDAVPEDDHRLAAGVRLPLIELDAGSWHGPTDDAFGSLVLRGLLIRTTHRYGRANVELFGPGDLVPAPEPEEGTITWKATQETSLASLDERFQIAARRWPGVWLLALERCSDRATRLAAHLAALQLSRIDDRLEAVMWQLAHRFGKVTSDGVVLPIPFTHAVLGQLTAAKRPTVSVALAQLAVEERVIRLDAGWLLRRPGLGEDEVSFERRLRAR